MSSTSDSNIPQEPEDPLVEIPLQPENPGSARGNQNRPIIRRFLIDTQNLNYNVPAQITITVQIEDRNTRRPVNLTINSLSTTINAINVDPIMARILKIERNTDNLQDQVLRFWQILGEIEMTEQGTPKKTIINRFDELPKLTAQEAGQELVGESFFRFDTTSRYYPTLIFHFKEKNVVTNGKRTQVKIRWTAFSIQNTFTIEHRQELERRMQNFKHQPLEYWSGPIRVNFVSTTQARWKTTLYVQSENEAHRLLTEILFSVDETFSAAQLSVTTGRKLSPATTVAQSLSRTTEAEWERSCKMELNKIMLQINGADRMMEIFRKGE
jgi:hypothetical protein